MAKWSADDVALAAVENLGMAGGNVSQAIMQALRDFDQTDSVSDAAFIAQVRSFVQATLQQRADDRCY